MSHVWKDQIEAAAITTLLSLNDGHEAQPNAPPVDRDTMIFQLEAMSVLERALRSGLQECALELRALGVTWRVIGEASGTTASNVYQRWRTADDTQP